MAAKYYRLAAGQTNFVAMKSLGYLLDAPVPFRSAPDLFCLDLYKDFDIDRFAAMAEPAKWEPHYLSKPAADSLPKN